MFSFRPWVRDLRSRARSHAVTPRLRVEALEDRLTPANKIWTGAIDSSFTTGGNWVGGAPTMADVAVFDPTAGGTNAACTINAAITVRGIQISGGYSGTITNPSVANTITLKATGFSQSSGSFLDT